MSRIITKGSVDVSTVIRIIDSTDGTPETGVTSATAGLDLQYRREGAAAVALTESDLATVDAAHADGGMIHIGAGYYRVDLPDAAVATGANGVLVFGTVTGMIVQASYHPLVTFDLQSATVTVGTNNDKTGYSISGTLTTLDALNTQLATDHGAGSWITATGFSTHSAADVWSVATRTLTAFAFTVDVNMGQSLPATPTADTTGAALKDADTNLDATVSSRLASASYTAPDNASIAAILDDTGTSGVVVATATQQAIADEILKRSVSNVEASAGEHTLCTIVLAMLESAISGTTWTIKRTDGSTTHATKTLTTNAAADPITGVA